MADLSDVENALVAQIASVLFPAGGYTPGPANYADSAAIAIPPNADLGTSPAPVSVTIYRGWPVQATLSGDLNEGNAHVSIFPESGVTRDTTRYQRQWTPLAPVTPTLTVTVAGQVATFAGTGGAGQVAGITFGPGNTTPAYVHRLTSSDTPATVAAALAGAITGATVSGAAVTLPGRPVTARVVADQTAVQEVKRQVQTFRVSIWAPTPMARDAIGTLVEQAIAEPRSLALPDGTATDCLRYAGVYLNDMVSRDLVWRRDIRVTTEYATTITATQTPALFPSTIVNGTVDVGPIYA